MKILRYRKRKRLVLYSAAFFLLYYFILPNLNAPDNLLNPAKSLPLLKSSNGPIIEIGLVQCSGRRKIYFRDTVVNPEDDASDEIVDPPLTLIKSVLISAKLSGADRINFHIFTDSIPIKKKLETKISEFTAVTKDFVQTTVHFYNTYKAIPKACRHIFLHRGRKKCGYIRVFFPNSIPKSVKEILYLDTDTIITGNIVHIWNSFKEKVVTNPPSDRPPPLAALVQNSEVYDGKLYLRLYKDHFSGIKHVAPRGVNSGVMFMNLEAMREFNWSVKLVEAWVKAKGKLTGDQQLLNVFFHDNLDRLVQFPCQYNFQHLHCERGLTCTSVTRDPGGIYIMHGAGETFHSRNASHAHLFQAYKEFPIDRIGEVERELFVPVQLYYTISRRKLSPVTNKFCNGIIGKYLFQRMTKGFMPSNVSEEIPYRFLDS